MRRPTLWRGTAVVRSLTPPPPPWKRKIPSRPEEAKAHQESRVRAEGLLRSRPWSALLSLGPALLLERIGIRRRRLRITSRPTTPSYVGGTTPPTTGLQASGKELNPKGKLRSRGHPPRPWRGEERGPPYQGGLLPGGLLPVVLQAQVSGSVIWITFFFCIWTLEKWIDRKFVF